MGKFGWFVLGVVAGLLFAYRKELVALYQNRKSLSAGEKVVSGVGSVVEGGKALFEEIF